MFLVLCGTIHQLLQRNLAIEPEFLQPLRQFFRVRSLAVPARNVLHEADALALHGIGNDHHRLSATHLGLFECPDHLLHVVPVDRDHFPAKAAILLLQRLDVHHVLHPAVDLQAVTVDNAHQVVEFVVPGFHGRFPDLSFLLLAVAHDAEGSIVLLVELSRQRDSDGDAQALPQRSGGHLDSGQLQPVRMSLVRRVQLAQIDHIFLGTETGKRQPQIEARRLVAGGPDDAVAIRPVGILRIVVGHTQVECRRDVHDRERAPGVSRTGRAQHNQVVPAHQVGLLFQFIDAELAQDFTGFRILDRHGVAPSLAPELGRTRSGA